MTRGLIFASCLLVLLGLAAHAFMPTAPMARGRSVQMFFGPFKKATVDAPAVQAVGSKAPAKRLNLKDIKKAPAPAKQGAKATVAKAPVAKAAPVKTPFGKPAAKAVAGPPATKEVNGKLQGYFSEAQLKALIAARQSIPSDAPQYWEKIAARVPGQTVETCKAMAYQLAFDKSAGTKSGFFGGYVEVKETQEYVDADATPMKRFKQAFGLK
jgi:hypothetical protein